MSGLVAFETLMGLFYWLVFPPVLYSLGVWRGALTLMVAQAVLTATFVWLYDRIGNDFLGVIAGREVFEDWMSRRMSHAGRAVTIIAAMSFMFSPPVMYLYLRPEVSTSDGSERFSPLMLLGTIVGVKTTAWVLLNVVIYYVFK